MSRTIFHSYVTVITISGTVITAFAWGTPGAATRLDSIVASEDHKTRPLSLCIPAAGIEPSVSRTASRMALEIHGEIRWEPIRPMAGKWDNMMKQTISKGKSIGDLIGIE